MSTQHSNEPTQAELDQAMKDMDAALLDSAQDCGLAAVDLLGTIMNADYEEGAPAVFQLRKMASNLDRFIADEVDEALARAAFPDLLAALKAADRDICNALVNAGYDELYKKEELPAAFAQHVTIKLIRAAIAKAERRK